MTSITSQWSSVLDAPPSCVAFCPRHADILVVGTYVLHQQDEAARPLEAGDAATSQKRTGSLIFYRLENATL